MLISREELIEEMESHIRRSGGRFGEWSIGTGKQVAGARRQVSGAGGQVRGDRLQGTGGPQPCLSVAKSLLKRLKVTYGNPGAGLASGS